MKTRIQAILMATLLCGAALASAAESLTFNGYHAGMSKAAAKSIGVETCRNGEGPAETKDAIYCDIPASKRSLGTMTATKAVLEFKAPSHASVNQIRLIFSAPSESVRGAMQSAYGAPSDDEDYFYWERGAETGKLYKGRRGTSYVTFEFDASVGKARAKANQAADQKNRVLRNF